MSPRKPRHFRTSLTGPQEHEAGRYPSIAVESPMETLARTLDSNGRNRSAGLPTGAPSLGPPMDIQTAATLLGCSTWTVRQRLIPMGLPCFQASRAGKLIFYRDQVVRWIETQQKRRIFAI
jgi:hypothetical protein